MNARALLDEVSGRNQWDLRGWVGAGSFHALRHPPTDRRASAEPVGRKGRWHDITANWLGRDECLQVKWDGIEAVDPDSESGGTGPAYRLHRVRTGKQRLQMQGAA